MFLLVKILISSAPHICSPPRSYTMSYGFPTCQILKLHLLAISKRSDFLQANWCLFFPYFLSGQWLLVTYLSLKYYARHMARFS